MIDFYPTLGEALAAEEERWQSRVKGIALWSSSAGLSVPASYRSARNFGAACALMDARGWPVNVRQSGGGCVPQGGVLNIGWTPDCEAEDDGIDQLYQRFASAIIGGLEHIGIRAECFSPQGAWCPGRYDISSRGRKLAGISQRRSTGLRPRRLVHAAVLVNCPLERCFGEMSVFLQAACCAERPNQDAATTIAFELPTGVFALKDSVATFAKAVTTELVSDQEKTSAVKRISQNRAYSLQDRD